VRSCMNKYYSPKNMTPVAMILVSVVPSLLAMRPPTRGVHVLFKLNAEISRLNSVLDVLISRASRDFSGPSVYDAL
jgi:hypothetical protein